MTDAGKRQAYDLTYHSIQRGDTKPQSTQQTHMTSPPPASAPLSETHDEVAQIAALRKAKKDRKARWKVKLNALRPTILELRQSVCRLEHEIGDLASFEAAERAAEARKYSWATWIMSPFYKEREESEEENGRGDRVRQERRSEKDLKERLLSAQKSELLEKENELREAKKQYDAKNLRDDQSILIIERRKERKEAERRQKELAEQATIRRQERAEFYKEQEEAEAKKWRQQHEQRNKRAQEAREQSLKAQAEAQAARAAQRKEHERRYRHSSLLRGDLHFHVSSSQAHQFHSSGCSHNVWWNEVEERAACPECHDVWTYLLRCPRCYMKACPRCLDILRPINPRHLERTSRRETRRPRSPSPSRYDYGLSGRYG